MDELPVISCQLPVQPRPSHTTSDFGGGIMSAITVGPEYAQTGITEGIPGVGLDPLHVSPNPFNPTTTIDFKVPGDPGEVVSIELTVCDLAGHIVRELRAESMQTGPASVRWDGRDANGAVVSSGAYIVRLRAGGRYSTKSMTLLK